MYSTRLSCYYYPTTVTIIDDDPIFLESLVMNLSNQTHYKCFDLPGEALSFLQLQQNKTPTPSDFFSASEDFSEDTLEYKTYHLNVNLIAIHSKLYNPARFSIPSVVVVDQDMPGMTGIEFCRTLIDYPIKKIMLTGVADNKLAINAFNTGIIHKFISKDDPDIFESLDAAILEMQKNYFFDLSEMIIDSLKTDFTYLKDKRFVEFFLELCKRKKIVEFYLIDSVGSFLLINDVGKLIWLIVKSDKQINNDWQIAIGQNASNNIIQLLFDRKNILFLFTEEDYMQPVERWPQYLHQANKLQGVEGCYYAIIEGESSYQIGGISKEQLYSYNNYLTSNQRL